MSATRHPILSQLPRRIASGFATWWAQRRVSPLWTVAVAVIAAIMLLPVLGVAALALGGSGDLWPHLFATVLPAAIQRTLTLMLGVGLVTLIAGAGTAWLVTMFRFPARDVIVWLLLVPLAMPTYIVAYCYGDLFDFTGPLQTLVRFLTGAKHAKDYWFPAVKSLPGAVFVFSSVLYPYVYLSARASFLQQSAGPLEVARTLGHTLTGVFWRVALPMARPALVAGVSLVMMECLNDVGAVQYLGVPTLTATAYATWLQRSSLAGAAQISLVMLAFVLSLFLAERALRGDRGFHDKAGGARPSPEVVLSGWRGAAATTLCLLPVVTGFALPMLSLLRGALAGWHDVMNTAFLKAAATSLGVSLLAALVTGIFALLLAYARRVAPNGLTRPATRLASLGYAIPGTVLALGLMWPLSRFDNWFAGLTTATMGLSPGLLLSGTVFIVVLAYVIRFMSVSLGAIESGLTRISPNLDAAARTLGQTAIGALWSVHLPLLRPPFGAALLLVFVDCMKELPATLLLRPFNFETLATRVYGLAALDQFEDAALASLMIVLVGMAPLLLLNRAMTGTLWPPRRK
jgi:iron(III) transport system permease protein